MRESQGSMTETRQRGDHHPRGHSKSQVPPQAASGLSEIQFPHL